MEGRFAGGPPAEGNSEEGRRPRFLTIRKAETHLRLSCEMIAETARLRPYSGAFEGPRRALYRSLE